MLQVVARFFEREADAQMLFSAREKTVSRTKVSKERASDIREATSK